MGDLVVENYQKGRGQLRRGGCDIAMWVLQRGKGKTNVNEGLQHTRSCQCRALKDFVSLKERGRGKCFLNTWLKPITASKGPDERLVGSVEVVDCGDLVKPAFTFIGDDF